MGTLSRLFSSPLLWWSGLPPPFDLFHLVPGGRPGSRRNPSCSRGLTSSRHDNADEQGPAATKIRGVGREEPGDGRRLHRHIPEGPRQQEDHRPRAVRHPASIQERQRQRLRLRQRQRLPVQIRQQLPVLEGGIAQTCQEEVVLLRQLLIVSNARASYYCW